MNTQSSSSMVPSNAGGLLRGLAGKKVARLVRYSWWPGEEVSAKCGINDEQAFSLTVGPLAVYFEDGAIIGLASDPSLNSVVVWDEEARRNASDCASLEKDSELFAIAETGTFSTNYWRQFNGLSLKGMVILKRIEMNAKERERPSEVGLNLKFEGGKGFIASHGLHDDSDDFSVLEETKISGLEIREITIF